MRKLFYIFLILVTATLFVPACGDETKPASGKNLVSLEITLNAPGSVELHSLDDITADPIEASSDADNKILVENIPHGLYTAYLTPLDLEKFESGEMSPLRVQARDDKVNPGGITRVKYDFQEKGGNVEPWAKLKVTVRLEGGSLANGAVVEAGSTPENKAPCTTDATGACEFEVVPNEPNSVEVTLDGYQMGFQDGVIVSPFSTIHVAITLVPVSGAQPGDIVPQDDVYRLAGLPATLMTFKFDDNMKPEIEITSEVLYYLNDETDPLATNELIVPAVGECATIKVVWSNGKNDLTDPDDEFQVCGI